MWPKRRGTQPQRNEYYNSTVPHHGVRLLKGMAVGEYCVDIFEGLWEEKRSFPAGCLGLF